MALSSAGGGPRAGAGSGVGAGATGAAGKAGWVRGVLPAACAEVSTRALHRLGALQGAYPGVSVGYRASDSVVRYTCVQ